MRPPAIPNYRLFRLIGEGGFGEVWQAESVTGKFRAVKIVRRSHFESSDVGSDELESVFQREFKGVRRFEDLAAENPALISIHHVGRAESGEFYYYVMPLADDTTPEPEYLALNLDRKITRDGPMDWVTALAMVRRLASGLESLYRNDLCHGDFSSANVLFLDGHPVLADPGLTGLDGKASISHSPGFTDLHAEHVYSQQGDLFALGRVLYHALTGLHPAESYPLVPLERMKELPVAKMADILDRCGDPDPGGRFHDIGEMIRRLDAELAEAGASTPGPVEARHPRRGILLPALAAATLILLALGAWLFLGVRSTPPHPGYAEIDDGWLMVFDGKGGSLLWSKNLVLVAGESHGWFPTALQFLDPAGNHTAIYWHPGHIDPKVLRVLRETPDSLPMLAIKAFNNDLSGPQQNLAAGKQKHTSAMALLDPRQTGHHEAPPGRGLLNGHDGMSTFYRILTPQWADLTRIYKQDTTRDGKNEIIVWCQFGDRDSFITERIHCGEILDFQGNPLGAQAADGHIAESFLVDPETLEARDN